MIFVPFAVWQAAVAAIDAAQFEDILLKVIGALCAVILTWVGTELRGLRRDTTSLKATVERLSLFVLGPDGEGGPGSVQYEIGLSRDRYHDMSGMVTEHEMSVTMLRDDMHKVEDRVGGLEDRERERWGKP